ncbi:hypothetical protein SR39_02095 [Methylobacterium radiotolerans]|jgi:hypothetical protein|nr:hypothetical protein SR39_02095 [Methylobacterium radiotolerans]
MTVTMHARLKSGQAWRASSFGNRSAKVERGQAGSRQVEAPDRQLQPASFAADRQVGGPSMVAAMDRRAAGPARRAAGMIVPSLGEDGEGAGAVPCDTDEATAGQRAKQGHAPIGVLATTCATGRPSR